MLSSRQFNLGGFPIPGDVWHKTAILGSGNLRGGPSGRVSEGYSHKRPTCKVSKKHFQLTVLTRPFSTFQSITINRRNFQFLLIYYITCNSSGIYIFNSAQGSLVITITLYQIFFESLLSFITNERAFEWTSFTFIFVTFLGLILGHAIYERNQRSM